MPRIFHTKPNRGIYEKTLCIPADQLGRPNTNPPTVVDQGNLTLYSLTVNTDKVTYKLTIPYDYVGGDIYIIVGWTNDGGVDDNGKNVKWQMDYQTGDDGDSLDGNHANSPKSVEDTYASASGWIMHHTAAATIGASDFSGKHAINIKLSAVTPAGTALTAEPHLVCMDIVYRARWGKP